MDRLGAAGWQRVWSRRLRRATGLGYLLGVEEAVNDEKPNIDRKQYNIYASRRRAGSVDLWRASSPSSSPTRLKACYIDYSTIVHVILVSEPTAAKSHRRRCGT